MHIQSFRIVNYKGFDNSETKYLKPGFNVVVGQNNVGKTALAEALSLNFSGKPHRSTTSGPNPPALPDLTSLVELSLWVGPEELNDILWSEMPSTFYILGGSRYDEPSNYASRFQALVREGVTVRISRTSQLELSSAETIFRSTNSPRLEGYPAAEVRGRWIKFNADPHSGQLVYEPGNFGGAEPVQNDFVKKIADVLRIRIYSLQADRFSI